MIRLYDYWRSSASYRVRIALAMKDVAYERHDVNLLAGEQGADANRARNAQGFVPTLEVDGQTIGQSLAIIDWLDSTYPDPPLLPRDPMARAHTLQRALAIAADIHPVNNLRILKRLSAMGIDQAGRDDWYRHWVADGFAALEAMAGEGRYLGGETLDLSDVCLVPQMYNARRLETPLDAYPRLVAIDSALNELPAFQAARPDRFAPA
ncbi:maleylacetoacetate isomerase [Sphingomonas sp.]|jgi:maleylacetoacetate isomerase|uniref:maleylacetoacetate isomerase n=1 Tax=Sphingomonas sp. TaxID=28214 RepID=UPI002E31C953|nr:maleylacetoacetate isomerase [Sphingomonas sp.]HEX4694251.1 maleylacetoacetate isomerase [Sphingomonas sp.]